MANPNKPNLKRIDSSIHEFDTVQDAVAAFSNGEFVIVLDDTSRENEGDMIIASEHCTAEKMAFLIRFSSGYVCTAIPAERADTLALPSMVQNNKDPLQTAYTVSTDAVVEGMTTGVSAHDRALTVRLMAEGDATAADFRRPGHVLPLRAVEGLVRARRGHTEAALELCRLAGKKPAAALCEMVLDGRVVRGKTEFEGAGMMRRDDCLAFGKEWGIRVCTIQDLVEYVEEQEGL
ncbi:unnamed protein product [Periconia digitata]|uniref:3,4-dihydroxy-2-butanone 4-phosphate synthase n=1 Tax=Periconia digitata TaxID=1303443 RepID=A0A9W4XQ35_9PLEO|nr:unnamed protein product [Periconia digitata]